MRKTRICRALLSAVVGVSIAGLLAACGSTSTSGGSAVTKVAGGGSASTRPGHTIEAVPYAAIKGPWLVWKPSSCRFGVATSHPATYQAVLRRLAKPEHLVFTPFDTVSAASTIINASVAGAAQKAGAQLIQISNEYPSVSRPLAAADEAAATHPDAVISASIVAGLYNQIQPKYEAKCIPMADMFAFPTPHPSPGFQSSFANEGNTMANAAVGIIKRRQWPASQIWILTCGEPKTSPGPGTLRDVGTTFRDAVARAFSVPAARESPILDCNTNGQGALDAQTATTNWLTAHPQAKYVVGSFWVDAIALGMAQSLKAHGFGSRALVAGGDASAPVLKVMAHGDPVFQVDADKDFVKWGTFAVSIAEDIVARRPIPSYMDPGTIAVTPANVNQVLATRAAFLKQFGKK